MSLEQRARGARAQTAGDIVLPELTQPVEVLRDRWGIPHIYARTVDDLFFVQGFVAAQDRLWQMEIWRRAGEGRLAEILGPAALERDIFCRLIRYRGDMETEWASYAPDARPIITAFVRGVNAYIRLIRDNPPVEFQLMGFVPEPWTPEVCLTRLAGYEVSRGLGHEVIRALLAQQAGPEEAARLMPTDPPIPIEIPEGLALDDITLRILSGHRAVMGSLSLKAEAGSNNWVVAGAKSATGHPILANDPHRTIALPSLRYMVHLVAPGWNVIGAGEPALPGVALGHNERVAFGFTIFMADNQDLYVEELHPDDPARYRYGDAWLAMEVEKQRFYVKGQREPLEIPLAYTRHGPVIYEDRKRRRAYALRWTGSEPGAAGYLAALSLNRATDWAAFLAALERWKLPVENHVYADVDGNIGYQVAGLVPVRRNWQGILPVPGSTGVYAWEGFLRLDELPRAFNPPENYIVTANHRTLAPDDPRHIGYDWDPGYRFRRIDQVLRHGGPFTVNDFIRLQEDVVSLPAQELVRLLELFQFETDPMRSAARLLREWDGALTVGSSPAALYEMWVYKLAGAVLRPRMPEDLWPVYCEYYSLEALVRLLKSPDRRFGPDPVPGRDQVLKKCLITAMMELSTRYGPDMRNWRWGQMHTVTFAHPLADRKTAAFWNRGPYPRGGDGHTVNNTSDPLRANWAQTGGASYRQILDVSNWDHSVAINVPGQSGQPGSPHYDDLIPLWNTGVCHPLPYSRPAVEAAATARLTLLPATDAASASLPPEVSTP
jgi:penicillin amidase